MNYLDMKTGKLLFKNSKYVDVRPFNQGLAPVKLHDTKSDEDYWTFIDKKGSQWKGMKFYGFKVSNMYSIYEVFADNSLACLQDRKGKWGVANKQGKIVVPFKYDFLGVYSEGLLAFDSEGKYGYLDTQGKEVIKAKFDNASSFNDGVAIALQGDNGFLIDKKGKRLLGDSNISPSHYFEKTYDNTYTTYTPSEYLIIEKDYSFGYARVIED